MNLGEKLYKLRKSKNLSQEEAAEKLDVTRQTISKWETNQSTPDFDKIVPLCELYEISTDELLLNKKKEEKIKDVCKDNKEIKEKRAKAVSLSVFLYFMAIIWIIIAEAIEGINENILVGIFMLICAISTANLIYQLMSTSNTSNKNYSKIENKYKEIDSIIAIFFFIIYILISFITMTWSITWLIWIVYALVIKIIHLILELKEK